jgi:hypothetical protein
MQTMSERPKFAKGGYVHGPDGGHIELPRVVYQHHLADPADHDGHPIRWDGFDTACGIYIYEHLIKSDGYCSVCGAHVVDVEAARGGTVIFPDNCPVCGHTPHERECTGQVGDQPCKCPRYAPPVVADKINQTHRRR